MPWARTKRWPAHFGIVHGKMLTPHRAIWTLAVLSAVIGMVTVSMYLGGTTPARSTRSTTTSGTASASSTRTHIAKLPNTLVIVTLVSNFGTFLLYMLTCIVAIVAFREHDSFHGFKHMVVPVFGLFANLACMLFYLVGPFLVSGMSVKEPYIALGICAAWGIYGAILLPCARARRCLEARKSRVYMVMEFAEGRSLRAVIRDRGRLPAEEALDLARQICIALVYLHEKGIVHRDLKPDNVLLDQAGQIKLLDFGIAMDEAARRLTWFGLSAPVGTPDYMAPEQVRGRRGDVRTDIYALGTLLYEMVTGKLPYSGANVHAVMRAKLNEDPRLPRDALSSIDPQIEEIILRAINRSPRERYASAQEMLADLEEPSRVVPRDRSIRTDRPLIQRVRLPRNIVFPATVCLVIVTLLVMNWVMGHSAQRHARPSSSEKR
jgi:serine/threonine protein kinase